MATPTPLLLKLGQESALENTSKVTGTLYVALNDTNNPLLYYDINNSTRKPFNAYAATHDSGDNVIVETYLSTIDQTNTDKHIYNLKKSDNGIKSTLTLPFVLRSGDTMSGALTINNTLTVTGKTELAAASSTTFTATTSVSSPVISASAKVITPRLYSGNTSSNIYFGDTATTHYISSDGSTFGGNKTFSNNVTVNGTTTLSATLIGSGDTANAELTVNGLASTTALQIGNGVTLSYDSANGLLGFVFA